MAIERKADIPLTRESESIFDAQSCFDHSTTHNPPHVFPLLSADTFVQFIPGSTKLGNFTFPGMKKRIAARLAELTEGGEPYTTFNSTEDAALDDLSEKTLKKFWNTDRSLLTRTSKTRDFIVVTQPADVHYLTVSRPQTDGDERKYVAVNLTEMHKKDPEYVRETLAELYTHKGTKDVVEETTKEVLLHEQKRRDYELVYMLSHDAEKRDEELGSIVNFLETVGGYDLDTKRSIHSKNVLYKPPPPVTYPRPNSNYLEHVQDCPAATPEEKNVKDTLPVVWNALDEIEIEPIENPVLKNPLGYTETSFRAREKQILQHEQLAEFLDEETLGKDFTGFMSDLGTKLPNIQQQFTEYQNGFNEEGQGSFESKIIGPVRITGIFGRPTFEQIESLIKIESNPSLQEITRIIVLKYIQDQFRQETTDSAFAAEQIEDFNPVIAKITKDIKDEADRAEERKEVIHVQREHINRVLGVVDIDPEEIVELEKKLERTVVDKEKTFFLAFHMYRLQKAGSIDTTTPVFAQAAKTYFSHRGEEALEAVQAAL